MFADWLISGVDITEHIQSPILQVVPRVLVQSITNVYLLPNLPLSLN